ncbi:hypothetical protein BT93_K1407 [Corymbia citriodora subsp. variegata]|nr:hypothetical protein BT93_K1407 [Corymbia citriodora subsp. variegata]
MLQILLLLGSLLLHERASLAAPLAKGNCAQTCGGVAIPFPFGIGIGCFLDEWYEIICRQGSHGAIPILKTPNLIVLDISLPDYHGRKNGLINVTLPIIYSPNMSCRGDGKFTPVSLKGSQFIFSQSWNVFVAIGCKVFALIEDTKSVITGCQASCEADDEVFGKTCSGSDGCCQTTITSNLQEFAITFHEAENSTGNSGCNYAFLGDRSQFIPSTIDFDELRANARFAAVLEWGIDKSSGLGLEIYQQSFIPGNSYNCSMVSFDLADQMEMPFLQCFCNKGFAGNPYIQHGCEGIGASLVALPLLHLLWLSNKFMKKLKEIKLKERYFKQNGGLLFKLFNSKDLEMATDNFNENRIIGHGGQGTIYKGMLADGRIVAIKKSEVISTGKVEQFINEIAILSQINHRNIIRLLRCCLETESPLLVYEFIPNGTLFQYLHDNLVSWDMRLRIASEVAGALSYLHSSASIPIYHRDIKSTNILLDDKYHAIVADFGTSKSILANQTHVTTRVQGTFGYLDLDYFQLGQFTDKSDVYSFGVVLVELLTGQEPIAFLGEDNERNLASYFLLSMNENRLFDIVDTQVLKQGEKEGIVAFANLVRRCLKLHGKMRPTMKEVAVELERIRMLENPAIKDGHTQEKSE